MALGPRRAAAMVAVLALVGLAACGDGDATGEAAPSPGGEPAAVGNERPVRDRESSIPDVDVIDVTSGEEVALGGLVPSDQPLLVWFWAPH